MFLVRSFTKLVKSLVGVMTRPTFRNFLTIIRGWVFSGRRTVTRMIQGAGAVEILTNYSWRWSVEVTNHDSKQYLGFEDPQGWTRQAVERTAPTAMLLYSLIVLWFVETGHRSYRALGLPWYRSPEHPSFRDMLATLRRASLREMVSTWGLSGQGSKKALQALENLATLAT